MLEFNLRKNYFRFIKKSIFKLFIILNALVSSSSPLTELLAIRLSKWLARALVRDCFCLDPSMFDVVVSVCHLWSLRLLLRLYCYLLLLLLPRTGNERLLNNELKFNFLQCRFVFITQIKCFSCSKELYLNVALSIT